MSSLMANGACARASQFSLVVGGGVVGSIHVVNYGEIMRVVGGSPNVSWNISTEI